MSGSGTNFSPSATRPYSPRVGSEHGRDSASDRHCLSSTSIGRSAASGRNPCWNRSSAGTSCGEESWVALEYIKQLIETARARGLPVIYTTGERRPDNWDAGSWRWKSTRSDEASGNTRDDIDGNEIVTTIAPGPRDIVIKKQKPSDRESV